MTSTNPQPQHPPADKPQPGDLLPIQLRVPAETKASWVKRSRDEGKKLTDWIVERVERK